MSIRQVLRKESIYRPLYQKKKKVYTDPLYQKNKKEVYIDPKKIQKEGMHIPYHLHPLN